MHSNRRYRAFHCSSMQIILISHPQAADSKSLMNVRDVFTIRFNDYNIVILERSYPTSTSSTARTCTSTARLLRWRARQCSCAFSTFKQSLVVYTTLIL